MVVSARAVHVDDRAGLGQAGHSPGRRAGSGAQRQPLSAREGYAPAGIKVVAGGGSGLYVSRVAIGPRTLSHIGCTRTHTHLRATTLIQCAWAGPSAALVWRGGWVAGWLGGWVAGWLGGWVAGWLGGWVAGWLGGWVAGWLGGWVAGWLGGWVAGGWAAGRLGWAWRRYRGGGGCGATRCGPARPPAPPPPIFHSLS